MTGKPVSSRPRGKRREELVRKSYDGLEVRDATKDVQIVLTPEAVESAQHSDELDHYAYCVLAQGIKRMLGAKTVMFFRTLAYADVKGEDGVRRVERFWLTDAARAVVEAFDRGEDVPADGRAIVLRAVPKHRQLEYCRKRNQARREKIARGEATREKRGQYKPRRDLVGQVRNGSGQVQFVANEDEALAA